MTKATGTQLLSRTFNLLRLFDGDHVEMSLSELAQKADLNQTTAYRILQALVNEGFLNQDQKTTKYSLGYGLIKMGELAKQSYSLYKIAKPHAEALAKNTGEGVTIEVLNNNYQVDAILSIPSTYRIGELPNFDRPSPSHCTATGKVQLAYLPVDILDESLPKELIRLTIKTIVDKDEFRKELHRVRERGYATNMEELELGLVAIAAPIWDMNGRVIAGISMGGPASRISENNISILSKEVMGTATDISKDLGFKA